MAAGLHRLPLEKPIYEIEDRISALEAAPPGQFPVGAQTPLPIR